MRRLALVVLVGLAMLIPVPACLMKVAAAETERRFTLVSVEQLAESNLWLRVFRDKASPGMTSCFLVVTEGKFNTNGVTTPVSVPCE